MNNDAQFNAALRDLLSDVRDASTFHTLFAGLAELTRDEPLPDEIARRFAAGCGSLEATVKAMKALESQLNFFIKTTALRAAIQFKGENHGA